MLTATSKGEKSNKSKKTSPRPSPRRSRKEDYEVSMHEKSICYIEKLRNLIKNANAVKLLFDICIIYLRKFGILTTVRCGKLRVMMEKVGLELISQHDHHHHI